MIESGSSFILIGLIASTWATFGGAWGAFRRNRAISSSAERAVYVSAAMAWATVLALASVMLSRDYRVAYVWEYTSNSLSDIYAVTALWAGQAGSLLWWLAILGTVATLALVKNRRRHPELAPHATWVLASIQFFFFVLLTFAAPPFKLITEQYPAAAAALPSEGNGLNPQLQNFGMIIHPPLLYLGYITFSIPFAFAIAALASGRLTTEWIKTTRVWTMAAWMILGFGILCGARWAYVELGWGGYWAWDPVENASLMPWLTGTAFLHSVMIEERRGMLRRWNMFLVILTFMLSIFGTFLTRSGILSSVHSFAQSGVGNLFIYFFVIWGMLASGFFLWRWKDLKAERKMDSLISRESAFLFQNLLLLGICGAIFWGTMYPIFSEFFTGEKITVTAPYFNKVILPLGLAVYLLAGTGPMISWRKASGESLKRNLGIPAVCGIAIGILSIVLGTRHWMASSAFGLAMFVVSSVVLDLFLCASARQRNSFEPLATAALFMIEKNHRRYGGFLTHVGMAILMIGLAGNAFNAEAEKHLAPGDTMELGAYKIHYNGYDQGFDGHRRIYRADLSVFKNGQEIEKQKPEISLYFPGTDKEIRNSEVAIRSTLFDDLYIIFAEPDGANAVIRMMIHPLIAFVWGGGMLAVMGGLVAVVPWKLGWR